MEDTVTFSTKHGPITLRKNDEHFVNTFRAGGYWDDDAITENVGHIKDRNVLEVGCHVGTDTVPYARALAPGAKLFAFEPQRLMSDLLVKNVSDNALSDRVVLHHGAAFCYSGYTNMSSQFLDGSMAGRPVSEAERTGSACNFGGLSLGAGGEQVRCYKIDDLDYVQNIGFIHSDAQGAEPFWLWGARRLIQRDRPIIFYENYKAYGSFLFDAIVRDFDPPQPIRDFDIKQFCMDELDYKTYRHGYDSLLAP